MATRDYLKHFVSTTQPRNATLGDEWFDPSVNKFYKNVALSGTTPTFREIGGSITVQSGGSTVTTSGSILNFIGSTVTANPATGVVNITTAVAAGGNNTNVQFNSSGTLSGSSNFTWDNSNGLLYVSNQLGVGITSPSQTGSASIAHIAGGNLKIDSNRQFVWDGGFPTSISGSSGSSGTITLNAGNLGNPVVISSAGNVTTNGIVQGTSYAVPDTGGSAQWVRLGRFTAGQVGYTIRVRAYIHQGFNAQNSQDFSLDIFFKTSNGSSTDANGFAGNSWYYTFGQNATNVTPKWVANAAGVGATFYDLFLNLPTFTSGSQYYVDISPTTSWSTAVVATGLSDPGVASSTVLISSNTFTVPLGTASFSGGVPSSSTGTGTVVVTGGAGISGNLFAGQVYSGGLTSGRVTFATTSGQLTDSANLAWNGSTLGVTGFVTTNRANLIAGINTTSWSGATGAGFNTAGTITDTSGAGGTIASRVNYSFNAATMAASVATTVSLGINLFVDAPVAGANTTFSDNYALYSQGRTRSVGALIADTTFQQIDGLIYQSANTAVATAGSVQGDATAITRNINNISSVGATTQGVRLPVPAVAGVRIIVRNGTGTSFRTYPHSGGQINTLGTNTFLDLLGAQAVEFVAVTTTQWVTLNATYGA